MASYDDDSDTLGSFSIDSSIGTSGNNHHRGISKNSTGTSGDRDMTEDEVAIMVKNALRKARRAMHSTSPGGGGGGGDNNRSSSFQPSSNGLDDDDDEGSSSVEQLDSKSTLGDLTTTSSSMLDEDGNGNRGGNATSALGNTKRGGAVSESMSFGSESDLLGASTNEDDLARRIEEEIHSARAFAEKVYYGGKKSPGKSTIGATTGGGSASKAEHASEHLEQKRSSSINTANSPGRKSSIQSGKASVGNNSGRASMSVSSAETEYASNTTTTTPRRQVRPSRDQRAGEPLMAATATPSSASRSGKASPGSRPPMAPMTPTSPMEGNSAAAAAANVPNRLALDDDFNGEHELDGVSENDGGIHGDNMDSFEEDTDKPYSPKTSTSKSTPQKLTAPSPRQQQLQVKTSTPRNNSTTANSKSPLGGNKENGIRHLSSPPRSPMSSPRERGVGSGQQQQQQQQQQVNKEPLSPSSINTPTNSNNPALSPSSANSSSSSPQSKPNTMTNGGGKREHRQVVFRHPYPLPPPPVLPRPDDVIVKENSVKESAFNVKWVEPAHDLLQLIQAAEDDNLVRRSNACGAIKVLVSKDNNQARLCRTKGLLDALVVASMDDAVDSDALDARTRAVTALLYLSEPKDNRIIVAKHPQVLEVLVKVIEEDTGEARLRACSALATLAKTPPNRGLIANTENLATVLSDLMALNAVPKVSEEKKKESDNIKEAKEEGEEGIERTQTIESRDDSNFLDEDSMGSYNSEDDRMLTNTFTGTFSGGTGTYTEDDYTLHDQSVYSGAQDQSVYSGSEGGSYNEEDMDDVSSAGYSVDDGSVQEEEGVEMQISSLKKLNIENHSDFLAKSQLSACATLAHLTKHCANAPLLSKNEKLLDNVLLLTSIVDSPLRTRCIEMLCNFTRFPSNNARLAAMPRVTETLLACGKSKTSEDRIWAIRTLQNLCSDASSKVSLATGQILSLLSAAAMRKDYDEQFAAVGALMNLSTEPGSIVPLTNTKTVVATLVHLAHSPNTPAPVRKIACDSLATIGLWLQTLASAGTVPEEIPFRPLPTHSATGWLRWDS